MLQPLRKSYAGQSNTGERLTLCELNVRRLIPARGSLLWSFIAPRAGQIAGIVLIVAAALLYGATLDDGLSLGELTGGDLITHHYAQVLGRPANAPGYPIYTMLGWLWFRIGRLMLPMLNPTQVLSLYSTLWALAALYVFYRLVWESVGHWPAAFLTAGFYATTYFFWYYAVTSEQYASAVLQTLLFVWWAFRWQRRHEDRFLFYSALNAGLCLANLVTVLLIVPPLIWFYLKEAPALCRRVRLMAALGLVMLLPLASYAFVFWYGAAHPNWRGAQWPDVWTWFFNFISTAQGRSELTWRLGPLTAEFPWLIAGELTWGVLVISLAGLWLLGRRRAILISLTFLLYLLFAYIDRLGNWYQVIMPVYPLILLGMGAAWAGAWRIAPQRWARIILVLSMVILIGFRLTTNWARADQSGKPGDDAIPLARSLIAEQPAVGAMIYGLSEELAALSYLTIVWGERPDLTAGQTSQVRAWLADNDARPLYVTRAAIALFQEEIAANLPLSSAGKQLIEVLRQPRRDLPAGVIEIDREVYAGLRLAGFQLVDRAPAELHVAFYWKSTAPLGPAVVSVRAMEAGQYLRSNDQIVAMDHQPVWNAYPFSSWTVGEVVRDDYVLALPPATTAPDGLRVLLYRPALAGEALLATFDISLANARPVIVQ